ncbi:hypothetical protein O9993_02585 [Vibrio lentus]|nr:hypothetical protein [Vibrio lentus]
MNSSLVPLSQPISAEGSTSPRWYLALKFDSRGRVYCCAIDRSLSSKAPCKGVENSSIEANRSAAAVGDCTYYSILPGCRLTAYYRCRPYNLTVVWYESRGRRWPTLEWLASEYSAMFSGEISAHW